MTHRLWSTCMGLLALLSIATSRSVRQLPSAYPPMLPVGYYGQSHYAYPPYGYGYQAPPFAINPPGAYYDNVYGVYKTYPGGGYPVRFDYNNRCSRNYIGIKPHPDQRQYYYVCKPNCVIFSKCRNLESFNSSSGRCVQHVPQHRTDLTLPQCQKEGRFPHPHDCKVYYRCDKNRTQPWLFACPDSTIFSPVEHKCLPGDQCPSTEISDSGSYIPQNCEIKFPECAEEGTFRSPTDCALYYTCRLQESGTYLQTRFKCPGSNSFDLERKLCRPRSEVDCLDYVPGPVPLPFNAPQAYYPPYPAAPLFEEDYYDTGAREQQPNVKSEKLQLGEGFERPSVKIVILPTTPATTTTSKPTAYPEYPTYPPYPSYRHTSHHLEKEPLMERLEVEKNDDSRRFKLSENIVIIPTTPAPTTIKSKLLTDTTKYHYKRYTYAPAKDETLDFKAAVRDLHLSQKIVILPTTTSTTTPKPIISTCPHFSTPSTTPKSIKTTVTDTTQKSSTATTTGNTDKPKTSTEKPTTTTPKTSTVSTTTQKPRTTSHKRSTVTTTTKKPITSTSKPSTITKKPTTTTQKLTTIRPRTTTQTKTTTRNNTTTQKPTTMTSKTSTVTTSLKPTKTTTVTTTTEKPTTLKTSTVTTTSPKSTTTSPKTDTTSTSTLKSTTTTPKTTTVTTTTQQPITTTLKTSPVTTTTQKPTTKSPKSTTTTQKSTTNPKTPIVTTTTQQPITTTLKTSTVTTTTQKPTTTSPKTTTTTQKSTTSSKAPTVTTTTQKPITLTTSTVTTTSQKPTNTTHKSTQTTPKISTVTTTTQEPITTTLKTSTVTTTTQEPTTTTTQKSTTSSKAPTVTTTTQQPITTTLTPSTVTTSSQKPTTSTLKPPRTTPKATTTKQQPNTSTLKTSTVTSTTQMPTATSPTTTTTTQKSTTSSKAPTVTTTTQKPITLITSTVTTTSQKPTTTTLKSTTTTPKIPTETTTSQKPITTTLKTSTVTTTTQNPETTSPKTTTTTQKSTTSSKKPTVTTTQKPITTTVTTSTITTTSQKPKPTTTKPTTTTPRISTVTTTTQKPKTTTLNSSTVTTTTKKITSPKTTTTTPKSTTTQQPETTTLKTTSVTILTPNSTTTELTTSTRPHCPDPDSTSDKNTNPACTQELQPEKQFQIHSPQNPERLNHTQNNKELTGRRNILRGRDEPDYMDDAPSSAEGESGQETTVKAPTMSTLAAAHLLRKLFHVISTTPPSREHAPSQRAIRQSPPGVTLAQMARHNLATSKPFIAHSLRLSIQQLTSTQKRSIQPKALVALNLTKKESDDSEYYDSETSEQYSDEENRVLAKTQPKDMSTTTLAAVVPVLSSTTEQERHKTSSSPSQGKAVSSTTAQPLESTTDDLDYNSGDSEYRNDEAPSAEPESENQIPGEVKNLEARKSFLLSLLKERLTRSEAKKPLATTAPSQTSSPSSTTSSSTSTTTRPEIIKSTSTPSPTESPTGGVQLPAKNSIHQSLQYYDDDDYMEDESIDFSEAAKKDQGTGIVVKSPPAATAKRHIFLPLSQQAMENEIATRNNVQSKVQFKEFESRAIKFPTGSSLTRLPGTEGEISRVQTKPFHDKVGHSSRLTVPPTIAPTSSSIKTATESSFPKLSSTSTETLTTLPTRMPRTFTASQAVREAEKPKTKLISQSKLEIITPTTPKTLSTPSVVETITTLTAKVPSATATVRREMLSVNSRPWLLASRNQTVHITPISTIAARALNNPVNQVNRSFNPLVSTPTDYSTEKVPQLIVKVYEPIDLKIVFCPKSCDQNHDHKYDPADNYKKSNCSGSCDEEEERVHKHVDIQWKPLEMTDIASFRNAA
ncbi:mucin-5AC isoform X2 [Drosophila rhopaloa]|uniref:Mucin-5AC isoform X2 n=1 Tax=Drosophila rhopaloa TaxID=1041015 RepID=A0A6P4FNE3_DRORH|nr:mucin-5AC isoform X2 [Drosophila rhopaloa]